LTLGQWKERKIHQMIIHDKWNYDLDKVKMNVEMLPSQILGKRFSRVPQRESNPWPSTLPVGTL